MSTHQPLFHLTFMILWLICIMCQDDFIGNHKYVAFNNITTINSNTSYNYTMLVSPSLTKSSYNPLFGQDKPWEANIENGYPNIIYDPNHMDKNKTFQLWYDNFIQDSNPRIESTLYAMSTDGIHWVKPDLGIIQWNGTKNNNIVFIDCSGVGVFKDIYTNNKNEQYKAFGVLSNNVHGIATSYDGIHWNNYRNLSINNRWDTHNNMFFDINASNEYIGITRGIEFPPRTVAKTNSNSSNTNSSFSDAMVVESGGDINQTYAQITFKYYNIYLGLVMIYASNTSTECVYCELSYSVDLVNWIHIKYQQLIPLADINSNEFDSYICFAAAYPIVLNNKILLYYIGSNGPHSDLSKRNSSFGLATIRLDGFAGITNIYENEFAVIESYRLGVNGKYFIVNSDIVNNMDGTIKVGFKDINGFELSDCDDIDMNVTDYIVSWNGNKELSGLYGMEVIVQFQLNNSILYTFGFVNDSNASY